MTSKEFRQEFKIFGHTDVWGNAMEAWFECAGRLYVNGADIPGEWEFSPCASPEPEDNCEEDSYFYELFKESTNEELLEIGNLLFRYCQFLKFKGVDY